MSRAAFTIIAMLALSFTVLHCLPIPDEIGYPVQLPADTKVEYVGDARIYPGTTGGCNPPSGVSCCVIHINQIHSSDAASGKKHSKVIPPLHGSSIVFEFTSPEDQKAVQIWVRMAKNQNNATAEFKTHPLTLDLSKGQKVLIGLDQTAATSAEKFFRPEYRVLLVISPQMQPNVQVSVERKVN